MKILSKISNTLFRGDHKEAEETKNETMPYQTDNSQIQIQINVHSVYNKTENYTPVNNTKLSTSEFQVNHFIQFGKVLNNTNIDMEKLKKLSWNGIPPTLRCDVWKILLEFVPKNKTNIENILARKRQEYSTYVEQHYPPLLEKSDSIQTILYNTVNVDVPRTQPSYPIFQHKRIQDMLKRLLYVWSFRKPACGYVQGINEIVTPFIAVYLSEYIDIDLQQLTVPKGFESISDETLLQVEADTFWSMGKILDQILDNFTHEQPGIRRSLAKVSQLIQKIDPQLAQHFKDEAVDFVQFAFRWVMCLFVREFPLRLVIRLFDTYIAEDNGFSVLHTYTCAALNLKFAPKLKTLAFNEIIEFLQKIPTQDWKDDDMNVLLAEAFVYMSIYQNSQGHMKSNSKSGIWH